MLLGCCTVTFAEPKFRDVPDSYWAAEHIAQASDLGIIYGYSDGSFGPKKNVNKQEAFVMLFRIMQAAGLSYLSKENPDDLAVLEGLALEYNDALVSYGFSDNSGMKMAAAYGLEYGVAQDSDFSGASARNAAPRELIAKWAAAELQYDIAGAAVLPFKDTASMTASFMPAIDALYRNGIMVGGTDGKFKPQDGVIRAEVAAVCVRMLKAAQVPTTKTIANTLVHAYGKVTVVNEGRRTMALNTSDGAKTVYISPSSQILLDGAPADFSQLSAYVGKSLTVSCLVGEDGAVIIQTKPMVTYGTVVGSPATYNQFYKVDIEVAGVTSSYMYTSDTVGNLPSSGNGVTFISDGALLLEID